jgi:PAS domain S-box-containing protein
VLTVRARIVLLIIAMGLSFGLGASIWLWWQLDQVFDRESHARNRAVAQMLSHINVDHMVADDKLAARSSLLETKAQYADIEYIYLVDFSGRVFAHTFAEGFPAALLDLKLPDEVDGGQDILHLKTDRGMIQHSSYPVILGSRARLHVGFSEAALRASINRNLAYVVLMTLGIAFVGCVIGFLVSRGITAPLEELAQLMAAYGRNDALDDRSVFALRTGGQELVSLRRAFREMIETRESAERLCRQNEEALRESFAHLRHAQKIAKLDYWVWDTKENRITLPGEHSSVIGVSSDELCGLSDEVCVERYVHPDDRERVLEAYGPASARNPAIDVEYRLVRPDGEVRIIHEVGEAVLDENGELICQVGTLQDITDQKRVEDALRDSEERFRDFTETASDWFWEMDEHLRYTYLSERFEEGTGVPIEEVIGLTRKELYDRHMAAPEKEDREKWRAHYGLLEDRQTYRNLEVTWCYPDGTERTFHNSGKPVFDEAGVFQGYRGTAVEITDRKRADEALRKGEASLTNAQRIAHMGNWDWDIVTGELRWSDEIYRIFGLEPQQFGATYEAFLNTVHPDDRKHVQESVNKALDEGAPYNIDHRIVLPSGDVRFVNEQGEVAFNSAGEPVRMNGVVLDITDRKLAEEALRESEAALSHAQKLARLGHWRWSVPRDEPLFISDELARVYGVGPDEVYDLLSHRLESTIHPEDRERTMKEFKEFDKEGGYLDTEYRIVRPDGEVRHVVEFATAIADESGHLVEQIGAIQDITERKLAEEEVRRLNEQLEQRVEARTAELHAAQEELVRKERLATLGQLTGTVSHELRNPLGAMRTSLAAIKRLAVGDDPMLTRSVEIADNSVTRCDNIIRDLLDYSRVRTLAPEPTALDRWLESLLDEYQMPPGIELRRDLDAGAELALDRDRLRQVVINLLDNACQAMTPEDEDAAGEGERLMTVATRVADARVELSVSDTGPGIPPEEVEKVFEPLYSTKAFGVGLGLPLVRQILEQHDGGIEVGRTGEGGARFVLWLPFEVQSRRAVS